MAKEYKKNLIVGFVFVSMVLIGNAFGATIFVDGSLPSNCTNETYDVSSRKCEIGSDGNAYNTITHAIAAADDNFTISIRSGTYIETNMSTGGKSNLTITAFDSESVKIHGTTVYQDIFTVGTPTTFRNLIIEGTKYGPSIKAEDWKLYTESGENHIWYHEEDHSIIQIYFDLNEGIREMDVGNLDSLYEYYRTTEPPYRVYVYIPTSNTNPAVEYSTEGMRETSEYRGCAFRGTGSTTDLVTIENCTIFGFSHTGVKLNKRWHIRNCYFYDNGSWGDINDHHIYVSTVAAEGKEVIIENNRFGYTPGDAISHYGSPQPSYFIIKNNIFDYSDHRPNGAPLIGGTGVSLNGSHTKIYGNNFKGFYIAVHMRLKNCYDNEIWNNIFYNNKYDLAVGFHLNNYPKDNTVGYNFHGGEIPCSKCIDKISAGGDDYSKYMATAIVSDDNPFVTETPSSWYDYRLAPESTCINAGANLGPLFNYALDPRITPSNPWPPKLVEQDNFGSGWEIGAFVYIDPNDALLPPQNVRIQIR